MGRPIGSGAFRKAWLIGDYVVKASRRQTGHWLAPPIGRPSGIRIAWTRHVGKWAVQRYLRPLTKAQEDRYYRRMDKAKCWHHDVWPQNMGRDARGRYVAFDW